jgi:hypothetical protein
VNAAEVVVQEVNMHSVPVILRLLAETVGQSGKAAHLHPHREVIAFHE